MIILSGEAKSTQHVYGLTCMGRYPRRYMTDQGKAIKEAYQWEAKTQWKRKPITGDVALHITFYFKDKRRRDLDNQHKLIWDALSGIVYEDDSQVIEYHVYREFDKARPRTEIEVREV